MKSINKINEVFNIDSQVEFNSSKPEPNIAHLENTKEDDFELARQTLRNLIHKNDDVMSELVHIAKNSEHPRAFEVAGQLIKAQAEIAKELMGLHKTNNDIEGGTKKSGSIQTQNNIVFAGSTADLMKLISTQRAKTIDPSS